jgi:hypothetical protein
MLCRSTLEIICHMHTQNYLFILLHGTQVTDEFTDPRQYINEHKDFGGQQQSATRDKTQPLHPWPQKTAPIHQRSCSARRSGVRTLHFFWGKDHMLHDWDLSARGPPAHCDALATNWTFLPLSCWILSVKSCDCPCRPSEVATRPDRMTGYCMLLQCNQQVSSLLRSIIYLRVMFSLTPSSWRCYTRHLQSHHITRYAL